MRSWLTVVSGVVMLVGGLLLALVAQSAVRWSALFTAFVGLVLLLEEYRHRDGRAP
jgi:ABC-type sugar transport system permease subunit